MIYSDNNKMSKFFSKVYLWMFIGLLLSGGVAYFASINTGLKLFMLKNYLWIVLLEFVVVIAFSSLRRKASPSLATLLFVVYSLLSGLTLSSIFLAFDIKSIVMVFLASAVLFILLAVYGYTTKQDLSSFGKMMMIGLFAIIIMSIINIFLGNGTFGIIISVISVVLFLGLTAWDMQMLKNLYNYYSNDEVELNKAAIYGALDLYLDFINIFIQLLNLFGKSRD